MLNTLNKRMQIMQVTLCLLFCVAITMLALILYLHKKDINNRKHTVDVEVKCQRCGRSVPVCLPVAESN